MDNFNKEYYYFVDCRKKNTSEAWKKLKISNRTFQDTYSTRTLINELNKQDKEYEYKNYKLVEVS
jgi:hypothetical protein